MPTKDELENVMYSYALDRDSLEEENRILKETVHQLKRELDKFRYPALMVCEVAEVMGEHAIIKVPNGNRFFVNIASECKGVKPGDTVLVEQKNLTIVRKIPRSKKFTVEQFVIVEKPNVKWSDIGGLDEQAEEIKEVVELPLKNPELFKKIGITPPKGILLYGPPGTGKTLLAKAVATSTKATFIEIVASELVQKFIGEGAKLVKEIFELAREKAPSIVFIDEIDALAARRIEVGTSGEREVQRTFMQLLAEIDGFKNLGNVKVIGCTNRLDILDPAVIRPGRLDRLIKVPAPDEEGLKEIFTIHTRNMKLDKRIDIDSLVKKMKGFSGAEVKAVATEAGYSAIRNKRTKITKKDFEYAIEKVRQHEKEDDYSYISMFG
ncbi:AAA family ATPase [Candidatus Woesearchaeota archaeon]|nr:MAG: AAA family ATPase [Candidatus Woesearchaeota archaeon]